MTKKLLEYNWKIFKNSLTAAKTVTLVLYSLFLVIIFANLFLTIFSIVTLQGSPQLVEEFDWLTAARVHFLLLVFANMLWLAQFMFTNIRQLQLHENRKLLTVGFPAGRLARQLTLLSFFHPLNLLFNITWIIFLYLLAPSALHLPLIIVIVLFNYLGIYSLKFRYLRVVKDYYKWLMLLLLSGLILLSPYVDAFMNPEFWLSMEAYIGSVNFAGSLLPGGLLLQPAFLTSLPVAAALFLVAGGACYYLLKDHHRHTKAGLQKPLEENREPSKQGHLLERLCRLLGNNAGKYMYYVFSHPYNKIQGAMFLLFPALYIPFALSEGDLSGTSKFFFFFFFIYPSLGFLLMFMGNIFGYENRELLLHIQLPVKLEDQIVHRFYAALILPVLLLAAVIIFELVFFFETRHIFTYLLGNLFIFLCFLMLYLWSSFSQYKKIPWVSFSYTQPVISQSVAFGAGVMMIPLALAVFIPFGPFEQYKQLFLVLAIVAMGLYLYRKTRSLKRLFEYKIRPRLWTEL